MKSRMKKDFVVLFYLLASSFLVVFTGCTTRIMSVKEGDFDVTLPPTLKGAEYEMKENSSIYRISADIHRLEKQRSKLSKVWTGKGIVCDGEEHCESQIEYSEMIEPGVADISYVFKSLPVALSLDVIAKKQIRLISYGFGLDPMPYGKISVGLNGRWGEIGLSTYIGIDFNETIYVYEGISASTPFIQSWEEPTHDISYYSGYQFHLRGGFGGYASVFLGPVALTYAPSVQSPWLWTDELAGDAAGYSDIIPPTDYDITFEFPIYFVHYIGLTYNIYEKVQLSAGLTVVNGMQLKERLYFGSGSIAYLF